MDYGVKPSFTDLYRLVLVIFKVENGAVIRFVPFQPEVYRIVDVVVVRELDPPRPQR